jgi:hypothetical protein
VGIEKRRNVVRCAYIIFLISFVRSGSKLDNIQQAGRFPASYTVYLLYIRHTSSSNLQIYRKTEVRDVGQEEENIERKRIEATGYVDGGWWMVDGETRCQAHVCTLVVSE